MHTEISNAKTVCFFAHFDRDDMVEPYVLDYIQKLCDLQFVVIFSSPCKLNELDRQKLDFLCYDVILRENIGLDFGSWADAYRRHGDKIRGNLLLANDSVYGPIGDLNVALDRLTSKEADFWGMIKSSEHTPHLQSWFLLLSPQVHQSEVFKSILLAPRDGMDKQDIIRQGELGLTEALSGAGFRVAANFVSEDGGPLLRLRPFNVSHWLWRELIEFEDVPFLKVELLRDNPMKIAGVEKWRSVVAKKRPALVPLIEAHLQRKRKQVEEPQRPAFFHNLFASFIWRDYHLNRTGFTRLAAYNAKALHYAMALYRRVHWARRTLRSIVRRTGRMV